MEFTSEIKKATSSIYDKVSKKIPEIEWATHAPYIYKIALHGGTIPNERITFSHPSILIHPHKLKNGGGGGYCPHVRNGYYEIRLSS